MDATRNLILQLAEARGPEGSICPSEAARAMKDEWRPLMKGVRNAAVALAREGRLQILRKGKKVTDLDDVRGVIRLRIAKPAP